MGSLKSLEIFPEPTPLRIVSAMHGRVLMVADDLGMLIEDDRILREAGEVPMLTPANRLDINGLAGALLSYADRLRARAVEIASKDA